MDVDGGGNSFEVFFEKIEWIATRMGGTKVKARRRGELKKIKKRGESGMTFWGPRRSNDSAGLQY